MPLSRRVADAAIMFDAISGPNLQDPTSLNEPPSNVLGQATKASRTYELVWIEPMHWKVSTAVRPQRWKTQ